MSVGACVPRAVKTYVRWVDALNYRVGRMTMYLIFVLIGVLLWSSISKTFFNPSLWTLEVAQFVMVAYYILGGPYSIQLGSNVRMDLFYGEWSARTKAWFDAFTIMFLIFFLGVLLYGGVGSAAYSLGYYGDAPFTFFGELVFGYIASLFSGLDAATAHIKDMIPRVERSATAWRPQIWPIKIIMCIGFILMLLQASAEFCRDIARLRGEEL